jgi:hypothetical protein
LTDEELLLSFLSTITDGLHGQSLYPIESLKWLSVLHSQFVQAGLCTAKSLLWLENVIETGQLQLTNDNLQSVSPQASSCQFETILPVMIDPVVNSAPTPPAGNPDMIFKDSALNENPIPHYLVDNSI